MSENRSRYLRHAPPSPAAGFGWMVLASLAVHALAAGVLGGALRLPPPPASPPYRVELVGRPVPRPQAGLPGGTERMPPPRSAPPAAVPPPKAPAPSGKALAPARKSAEKAAPPAAPTPAPVESEYQRTLAAIEQLKEKKQFARDVQALKDRIAQMHAEEAGRRDAAAPVGTPGGRGDQAGGEYAPWIRAQVKDYWTLPPALVTSLNLEAQVEIEFNAQGARTRYRFLESSRDARFDDSIRRALLQLEQLPTPPGAPLKLTITFNLKELMRR